MLKHLTIGAFVAAIAFIGFFADQTAAQKARAPRDVESQVAVAPSAQIMAEEFDYPVGQLTTGSGGNWITNTGTGNFIPIVAGSLTYAGYKSTGTGNKIQLTATTASAEDAYRSFTTQTSGTTYAAFLVNVLNTDLLPLSDSATGEYFAGFISSASTTAFASRVTIRQGTAANTYQLGLRASGNAGNVQIFSSTNLPVGTTALVVISYQLVDGTANDVTSMWINPTLGAVQPAPTLTQVSAADLADVGRFFIRQGSTNPPGVSGPNAQIDGIIIATAWADLVGTVKKAPGDFNGDGKTDFSIIRQGPGGGKGNLTWWIQLNGPDTIRTEQFGFNDDFILPADYDGDGSDDIAIWRSQSGGQSGFWVLNSKTGTASFSQIGQPGDDPVVVADYTKDGIDDFAIYRADPTQSYFWFWPSSGPFVGHYVAVPWGNGADTALFGDYNGDGFADFTIFRVEGTRNNVWTYFNTADLTGRAFRSEQFGGGADLYVPGDYDGDGTTDLAVTRWVGSNLRWIYKPSSGGLTTHINWGSSNGVDFEAHGDYDGDGTTDIAVWRTSGNLVGHYIIRLSGGGIRYKQWGGLPEDAPTIWEFKQ